MEDQGYDQICNSYRQLTEVRFKLLAFVPTISGAAIALISKNLTTFQTTPVPRLIIAILGFLVTLGVIIYDQRNSQLYNALVRRGTQLENELKISSTFSQRQARTLKLFGLLTIWHDRGLALIYGSVLGAWIFPIAYGVHSMIQTENKTKASPEVAAILAAVACVVFIFEFHRLDRRA